MGKDEIYAYLTAKGISYEVTNHDAVFNMEELGAVELPYPKWDAKNLFVRDDKKRNWLPFRPVLQLCKSCRHIFCSRW